MKKYRLIDLFAGCGGLTLGFTDKRFQGGFQCVFSLDNDAAAMQTHYANFASPGLCANIEDWLSGKPKVPQADVVVGGPPCQGFSLLNKKRLGDARRVLWEPFMDVVKLSRARVFVIENVRGLLTSPEFGRIRHRAGEYGFETQAAVLNAADYGTPQVRKRAIIVAWQRDLAKMADFPPPPSHAQNSLEGLPSWRTVHDAISGLPPPQGSEIRVCGTPLDLHFGRKPTAMSLERYQTVPSGGNRFDLQRLRPDITPLCWIRKKNGGTDLFGRLWWDRPAVTIRTEFFKPEKGRYLHPQQHRPITHREAARLMGFPDDFRFVGNKAQIARQIGNAVPPPLAGAIAGTITKLLGK